VSWANGRGRWANDLGEGEGEGEWAKGDWAWPIDRATVGVTLLIAGRTPTEQETDKNLRLAPVAGVASLRVGLRRPARRPMHR
jgi:hypothetical protein